MKIRKEFPLLGSCSEDKGEVKNRHVATLCRIGFICFLGSPETHTSTKQISRKMKHDEERNEKSIKNGYMMSNTTRSELTI